MIDHNNQRLSESLEEPRSESLETETDRSSAFDLFAVKTTSPAGIHRTISASPVMHPPSSPNFLAETDNLPVPKNGGEVPARVGSLSTQNSFAGWESRAFRVALAADKWLAESRPAPIIDLPKSSPVQPPSPEDQNRYVINSPRSSAIEFAINDLSARLDVNIGEINLYSFEQVA